MLQIHRNNVWWYLKKPNETKGNRGPRMDNKKLETISELKECKIGLEALIDAMEEDLDVDKQEIANWENKIFKTIIGNKL